MTGQLFVSGGFGPVDERYPQMGDSLRARLASADVEYERQAEREERARQARAHAAEEGAVRASIALAQERGELVDVRQAYRDGGIGRTKTEALEYYSARMDLEDAQRAARYRQQLRRAGLDPDTGSELELPQPSELAVEAAAAFASRDESPEAIGRGVRARWLRSSYRRME